MALPDSIPNSEVKRSNADGSVGFPHVRVGHRQIEIKPRGEEEAKGTLWLVITTGFLLFGKLGKHADNSVEIALTVLYI